jgi:hypothetical protein
MLEAEIERRVVFALTERISELTSQLATAPARSGAAISPRLAVVTAMLSSLEKGPETFVFVSGEVDALGH